MFEFDIAQMSAQVCCNQSWLKVGLLQEMMEKEYSEMTTEKGNPQFKGSNGTIMLISASWLNWALREHVHSPERLEWSVGQCDIAIAWEGRTVIWRISSLLDL